MPVATIVVAMFGLVGACLAAMGFYMEQSHRTFLRTAQPVDIEVVAMHRSRSSKGRTSYRPEFRVAFGPHRGATHRSSFSSNPPAYRVGQRAEGHYEPETGKIAIDDGSEMRFAMLFSSLGLGLMVAAAVYAARAGSL